MPAISYHISNEVKPAELLNLYADAGWQIYTASPDKLKQAVKNSLFVITARENNKLVGLLRAVGDGLTIVYIQDILVLKAYQRKGIGKSLIERTLDNYNKVRQIVLLTDKKEHINSFYENAGLKNIDGYNLMSFIKLNN
jgi:GNAT superfamily N-acetyltransferase